MDVCLISNDCMGGFVYQKKYYSDKHPDFIEYPSPFIAQTFASNEIYVKFCENFDYYMSIIPIFGNPTIAKISDFRRDDKTHPVMFLDDIEIHWSHDNNPDLVLKKFKNRWLASKNLPQIFLWTDFSLEKENEEKRADLVQRFCDTPHQKIFLTKNRKEEKETERTIIKFMPDWENKTKFDKNYRNNFRPIIINTLKQCVDKFNINK